MSSVMTMYQHLESLDYKRLDVFIQLGKDLEEDVLNQMLTTYFSSTEKLFTELEINFHQNQFVEIAKLAHKHKSSTAQLGLNKLSQACADLEKNIHSIPEKMTSDLIQEYITFLKNENQHTQNLLQNFLKVAA